MHPDWRRGERSSNVQTQDHTPVLPATFWILATGSASMLPDNFMHDSSQLALAVLALGFGLWTFWQHGRSQLTVAGVYGFCSAIFVGFSGGYWWITRQSSDYLVLATLVCLSTHILMYYIFWYRVGIQDWPNRQAVGSDPSVLRGSMVLGAVLAAVGAGAATLHIGPEVLAAPVAFVGVTMLCVSLAAHAGKVRRLGLWRLVLVAGACAIYIQYAFEGYGRLVLASLALVVSASLCLRFRSRSMKALGIIATGPAIVVLVKARESFGVSEYGQELDGLGSMTTPLQQFSEIIQGISGAHLGYGSTFWAALVTHVPSALWSNKPIGFGRVLALEYNPTGASAEGSLAALNMGEWFYNFGWLGAVVAVPVVGILILFADRWLIRAVRFPLRTKRDLLALTAVLIIAGSMGDYLWGGAQTYTARAGTRLLVVLALTCTWAIVRFSVNSTSQNSLSRSLCRTGTKDNP